MLCHVCQRVFDARLETDNSFLKAYYKSNEGIGYVESASHKGCYICRAVLRQWEKLTPDLKDSTQDLIFQYSLRLHPSKMENSILNVSIRFGNKTVGVTGIVFQKELTKVNDLVGNNTGSTETTEFTKQQLSFCNEKHAVCKSVRSEESWYPTRLIDLQPSKNSDDSHVRLVLSVEDKVNSPYASLSHCWGGADILKLTKSTINTFRQRISLSNLPKTFVDAITGARALGIRHIWIDSLCIIQDSKEDWAHEAVLIHKVYRNAYVNIAATNSKNSFGGLFHDRDPVSLGEEPVQLSIGPLSGRYRLVDVGYYTHMIDQAPLNRRAWVVQERLLSPRTLHFAAEQVLWDCYEITSCESCQSGIEWWKPRHTGYVNAKRGSWTLTGTANVDEGIQQWSDIVSDYSNTGISFVKDKIVAISGIAEHMQNILGDEYCAGLWRQKIEMQMCWQANRESSRSAQSGVQRAPTWSWLTVDAPVNYPHSLEYSSPGYDTIFLASVKDVKLESQMTPENGIIISGSLHIRCILNRVVLTNDGRLNMPGNPLFLEQYFRAVDWDFDDSREDGDEFFVIGLFELIYEGWTNWASEVRGIVLKCQAGRLGTYSRCGHVWWSGRSENKETRVFPEEYRRLSSVACKEGLPCEGLNEEGHLVRLI